MNMGCIWPVTVANLVSAEQLPWGWSYLCQVVAELWCGPQPEKEAQALQAEVLQEVCPPG